MYTAQIEAQRSLSKSVNPDLVLLTVKAYGTEAASRQLRAAISDATPVLSLQNGLGNIETLTRYLPQANILAGTTTEAALLTSPGAVIHGGSGVTRIGELNGKITNRLAVISTALRHGGLSAAASKNIMGALWSKAIVNSAINPISALARVTNGALLTDPDLTDAALRLVREGVSVARAHGVSLNPSPESLLLKVLQSSKKNRSSMLRDIEAGRKTEIRQLNGAIASLGRRVRIDAPLNTLMSQLVLGLETSRMSSSGLDTHSLP